MKNAYFLLIFVTLLSCKDNKNNSQNYEEEPLDVITSIYPENITKVFSAHGGIDKWNKMKSLVFSMKRSYGSETTTTNLKNRKSLIEMPNHTIGFNGEEVWLHSKDTAAYNGNARFYYNLMFYFYAMPFIVGDDGIIYSDVEDLIFEDKSYPGIKISYESGVGESPDDEYILYYNPETFQMEWLAYTVTYFSKEKGKEFRFLRYSSWQDIDGLILPETMEWYNYENHVPTTKRNFLQFKDVVLSEKKPDSEIFEVPEGAELID